MCIRDRFKKALEGNPEYMDYYIFREGSPDAPPTNWQSKFGGNAWEYVPRLKKWYLHLFDVSQADLNWDNPRVHVTLEKKKEKAMIFLAHQASPQMAEKKSCVTGKVWKESERKRIGVPAFTNTGLLHFPFGSLVLII